MPSHREKNREPSEHCWIAPLPGVLLTRRIRGEVPSPLLEPFSSVELTHEVAPGTRSWTVLRGRPPPWG